MSYKTSTSVAVAVAFVALFVPFVSCFTTPDEILPKLVIDDKLSGYHGLVRENETLVEVVPEIYAIGDVCNFNIVNKHHGEAPFEIILRPNGYAELRARKTLNCEKRKTYKFEIAAVSCSGLISDNVTVHITVVDINEYAPVFLDASYVKDVDEGQLFEEIIRVEATDRDCTPRFGDICKYDILNDDQPFTINNEGSIRNTEPLDYDRSHNYILSVVAYDCGMKQSAPVMVTIKVNRICKLGWKNIPEEIDYYPTLGRKDLFPNAQLRLCDDPCHVKNVNAKLTLATSHIGKGCDRDTYSVQSQRKLCGASEESVELLPANHVPLSAGNAIKHDEGRESDQMYEFDGSSTAVAIPNDVLDHGLSSAFTISTWMKHKPMPHQDKHVKEHILCSADDHKMNRHHYAWFVRNCRLILLLRRDFSQGDLNIFRPAEWRWKIPQVCDNEWHHYAVSVQFPNVQLYIDGVLFKSENKNPEVIDDWPLHPTKGINTTLTVGACWQGSENKMKHHLRGYLAGLSVLLHQLEKPEVLACLHKCKESLEVPAMELLEPGMELLTNSELTELSIEGDNKTNLEVLVKKIGYSNSRDYPTPGRRNLHLTTSLICDGGREVKMPPAESYIMVHRPQQPNIIINGTNTVPREYHEFRQGVQVFPDLAISIEPESYDYESKNPELTNVLERRIDSCIISVYPSLNPDHETLTIPADMLAKFGISAKVSKDGVAFNNADIVFHYQEALRDVHYTNFKPAYYLNRQFKLVCSEMNGRFLSNEYIQTLTVVHPKSPTIAYTTTTTVPTTALPAALLVEENYAEPKPAHAQVVQHSVESKQAQTIFGNYLEGSIDERAQAIVTGGGHAVTIIIVVCVGFLVLMITLGIVRIKAAHQKASQDEVQDTEMAWDDSALNITINPMEQLECDGSGPAGGALSAGKHRHAENDDDSSDDNMSYDYDDSSDDGGGNEEDDGLHRGCAPRLEWDHSTMSI